MEIRGAVLDRIGYEGPYRDTKPLTIQRLQLAEPGRNEVRVRIESAGLCHSDLSVVDGNRPRPMHMLLGHEAAGTVEACGPEVSSVAVGDRVVLTFLPRCGECDACATNGIQPCLAGTLANTKGHLLEGGSRLSIKGDHVHHHNGVSAFATHAVVDVRSVVRVERDVPPEVAALLGCAVLTGGGAVINVARPQPGESIAVVGIGGVGMAALLVALAYEDVEVIAVDTVASKLETALRLGAAKAIDPRDAAAEGLRANYVIEAAGNIRALETAIQITAPGGKTITVGLPAPDAQVSLSPTALVGEGRSLIGSYLGSAVPQRDIPRFVDLWRRGKLPVEELVTGRTSLDRINEALDVLASGNGLRQMINFASPSGDAAREFATERKISIV